MGQEEIILLKNKVHLRIQVKWRKRDDDHDNNDNVLDIKDESK